MSNSEIYTLPAGTYYIGDLCYVINDEDWDHVCTLLDEVVFHYKENKTASLSTEYGDGCYTDQFGNSYPVDAGIIGAVLVDVIDKDKAYLEEFGAVITFVNNFDVYEEDSTLYFGHIAIPTGNDQEEDDEENEEYEEEDYGEDEDEDEDSY